MIIFIATVLGGIAMYLKIMTITNFNLMIIALLLFKIRDTLQNKK